MSFHATVSPIDEKVSLVSVHPMEDGMKPSIHIGEVRYDMSRADMNQVNQLLDQLSPATKHQFGRSALQDMLTKCAHFLVARDMEREKHVVGIITLMRIPKPTGWYAEIQDHVVDSDYHDQGIGRALMLKAIELTRDDCRVGHIDLTLKPRQWAAHHLYVSLGFKLLAIANPDLGDSGTNFYRLTL